IGVGIEHLTDDLVQYGSEHEEPGEAERKAVPTLVTEVKRLLEHVPEEVPSENGGAKQEPEYEGTETKQVRRQWIGLVTYRGQVSVRVEIRVLCDQRNYGERSRRHDGARPHERASPPEPAEQEARKQGIEY